MEVTDEELKHIPTLWHYTEFRGLEGIVNKGKLWASGIKFLNDTQEFEIGLKLATDTVEAVLEGQGNRARALLGAMGRWFRYDQVFTVSFSAKGDDLSQWRGYGGAQTPFAVGFDPAKLKAVANAEDYRLVKVDYGSRQFAIKARDELQNLIAGFEKNFRELDNPMTASKWTLDTPGRALGDLFYELCASVKHKAFEDEAEYRLVKHERDYAKYKFRQGRSLVVPYLELKVVHRNDKGELLCESPITAATVGPTPHPDSIGQALRFMQQATALGFGVNQSTIPFRNW